ncbi:MAG: hypothetical protein KAI83_18280 [Thiomargarita sp.]|nr:hypothetical protein [Thiomargarita sp.]
MDSKTKTFLVPKRHSQRGALQECIPKQSLGTRNANDKDCIKTANYKDCI